MSATDCGMCSRPIDDHTVAEFRACQSALHDHDLPFESIPQTDQTLDGVWVGAIAVRAAVHKSPLGVHPVLVFDFTAPDVPLPPIALVLDTTHMRSVRHLVGQAIDAAVTGARRTRG